MYHSFKRDKIRVMSNKKSASKYAPIIMTALLVLIAIASVIWIVLVKNSKGETVSIVSNGITLKTIDLNTATGELLFTVINDPSDETAPYIVDGNKPLGTHYNVIRITREGAEIIDSDCSTHICIHEGITNSPAKPIVCLPNRLLITVTGEKSETDTDAVTY